MLAEMAVEAAKEAIARWGKPASEIDAVICAASNMQRAYPAMAIEVQQALGHRGLRLRHERGLLLGHLRHQDRRGLRRLAARPRAVLMVNPEICSGHLNFRDRDSHFIFGDVATAVIVEDADQAAGGWEILGTRLKTQFSNNIRNNFGFLNRAAPEGIGAAGQAVRAGGPQGVQRGGADGLRDDRRARRRPRHRPDGAEAPVAAPGQHQHERDDRHAACWAATRRPARTSSSSTSTPTPRSAGSIIAFHTRQRRLRGRRDRPDLLLRRGLFGRHGVRQEAVGSRNDVEPVFQLLQPVTSAVTPNSTAARRKLFSATELLGRQTVASAVMLIDVLFEMGIGFWARRTYSRIGSS